MAANAAAPLIGPPRSPSSPATGGAAAWPEHSVPLGGEAI